VRNSTQSGIATALLVLCLAVVTVLELLAHSQFVSGLLIHLDQEVNRIDKKRYSYEHYYSDFEDRLINEELPSADYSRGGVYLIGTSNLKWATRFWELPDDQRSMIHNYGIGATDHSQQFQFLRHLVEHDGLLRAGGSKTMVILGTSYHATGDGTNDVNQFFASVWQRHGLYSYSTDRGITPIAGSNWQRRLHFERLRLAGFVRSTIYSTVRQLGYHAGVRSHDSNDYKRERSEWLGARWQENMRVQVRQFEAMVDYLQARGVHVVVVLLPVGSWDHDLPFATAYTALMTEACEKKHVPILDWSSLLNDDDFADSNHPNLYGVDKLNPRFLDIAVPFLQSTGALKKSDHRVLVGNSAARH